MLSALVAVAAGGLVTVTAGATEVATAGQVQPVGSSTASRTLSYSEEFEGTTRDPAEWGTCYRYRAEDCTNQWNNELQVYRPGNVSVSDGAAHLTARRERATGYLVDGSAKVFDYTSGFMSTQDKVAFTYGYVEFRAKVVKGTGLWPALWMLPQSGTWPPEIDIMEYIGSQPDRVYMTNHVGGQAPSTLASVGPDYSLDWHTYAVDWRPGSLTFYVDGVERGRVDKGVPAEPMYLIANLAVGGNWPGSPDATTNFPATFSIDYVRVWDAQGLRLPQGATAVEPAPPAAPPLGNLEAVSAVAGGVRVRGWAADQEVRTPVAVDVSVGGITRRVDADLPRPDVLTAYPWLSPSTGFETVIDLPASTYDLCVTVVGSRSEKALGCRTVVVPPPPDVMPPTFTTGLGVELRAGAVSAAGLVPVTARWSATDDVKLGETRLTSPVHGSYGPVTGSAQLAVGTGAKRWTVVAVDAAGNEAASSIDRTATLVPEHKATLGGTWQVARASSFVGGEALRASRSGTSMSHTFTGTGVAWVASREVGNGRAHIYLDGVKVTTVDTLGKTTAHRQVVFSRSWASPGVHTIKVVVEGTLGRRNVTSDGFITMG